jgi:16S rRNA (guanine527-N7)-methyltransferase
VRDSLHSIALLPESGDSGGAIDVGSGGGLPGMVWAICRPELSVTLLDSVRKKCRALSEIAAELGLANVTVVWARCEEYALSGRERHSFAAARALAHAGVVAEYLSPLVRPGGRLAVFKGPKGAEELREPEGKWGRLGLSKPLVLPYALQGEERNYCLAVWEKIVPCPPAYPRKPGMALLKNWWK